MIITQMRVSGALILGMALIAPLSFADEEGIKRLVELNRQVEHQNRIGNPQEADFAAQSGLGLAIQMGQQAIEKNEPVHRQPVYFWYALDFAKELDLNGTPDFFALGLTALRVQNRVGYSDRSVVIAKQLGRLCDQNPSLLEIEFDGRKARRVLAIEEIKAIGYSALIGPGDTLESFELLEAKIVEFLRSFSSQVVRQEFATLEMFLGEAALYFSQREKDEFVVLQTYLKNYQTQLIDAGISKQQSFTIYRWLGKHAVAKGNLKALDQAIENLEYSLAQESPAWLQVNIHNLRGHKATLAFDYTQAYSEFHDALEQSRKHDAWSSRTDRIQAERNALNNLGLVCLYRGDETQAEKWLEACLRLAEDESAAQLSHGSEIDFARVNLINAKKRTQGQTFSIQEAKGILGDLLIEPNEPGLDRQRASIPAFTVMGLLSYEQGMLQEAEDWYRKALSVHERIHGKGSVQEAEILIDIGWVFFEREDFDEAAKFFGNAQEILVKVQGLYGIRTVECQSYLALAKLRLRRHDDAKHLFDLALDNRFRALRALSQRAMSQREQLAWVQELRAHKEAITMPGVLDAYLQHATEIQVSEETQYSRVLQWKGVLSPFNGDIDVAKLSKRARQLWTKRTAIQDQIRETAFTSVLPNLGFSRDEPSGKPDMSGLAEQFEQVERELAATSSEFAKLNQVVSPRDVARALRADSAFLDIIELKYYTPIQKFVKTGIDRRYLGFLTLPTGQVRRIEFGQGGNARVIDAVIRDAYQKLADGKTIDEQTARDLVDLIRHPIERALSGQRLLIVSGDGLMSRLPYGTIANTDGRLWLEDMSFSMVNRASSFIRRKLDRTQSAQNALVIGDVDYGSDNDGRKLWESLPATRQEVATLKHVLGKSAKHPANILTGAAATERALKEQLPQASLVHIATHGFFASDATNRESVYGTLDLVDRLDSALVLANANSGSKSFANDGYLTADELYELNLKQIDHLTLSACETGLGHISEGQGQVGVLGALEDSGVRTVVSSLWQVPSEATAVLMSEYYRKLRHPLQPLGPAEAMRQSQLSMLRGQLKDVDGRTFKLPVNWAAWVVSGNPY